MENWTNLDKGREGVKNPGNFADIICTWPLIGPSTTSMSSLWYLVPDAYRRFGGMEGRLSADEKDESESPGSIYSSR